MLPEGPPVPVDILEERRPEKRTSGTLALAAVLILALAALNVYQWMSPAGDSHSGPPSTPIPGPHAGTEPVIYDGMTAEELVDKQIAYTSAKTGLSPTSIQLYYCTYYDDPEDPNRREFERSARGHGVPQGVIDAILEETLSRCGGVG